MFSRTCHVVSLISRLSAGVWFSLHSKGKRLSAGSPAWWYWTLLLPLCHVRPAPPSGHLINCTQQWVCCTTSDVLVNIWQQVLLPCFSSTLDPERSLDPECRFQARLNFYRVLDGRRKKKSVMNDKPCLHFSLFEEFTFCFIVNKDI